MLYSCEVKETENVYCLVYQGKNTDVRDYICERMDLIGRSDLVQKVNNLFANVIFTKVYSYDDKISSNIFFKLKEKDSIYYNILSYMADNSRNSEPRFGVILNDNICSYGINPDYCCGVALTLTYGKQELRVYENITLALNDAYKKSVKYVHNFVNGICSKNNSFYVMKYHIAITGNNLVEYDNEQLYNKYKDWLASEHKIVILYKYLQKHYDKTFTYYLNCRTPSYVIITYAEKRMVDTTRKLIITKKWKRTIPPFEYIIPLENGKIDEELEKTMVYYAFADTAGFWDSYITKPEITTTNGNDMSILTAWFDTEVKRKTGEKASLIKQYDKMYLNMEKKIKGAQAFVNNHSMANLLSIPQIQIDKSIKEAKKISFCPSYNELYYCQNEQVINITFNYDTGIEITQDNGIINIDKKIRKEWRNHVKIENRQ